MKYVFLIPLIIFLILYISLDFQANAVAAESQTEKLDNQKILLHIEDIVFPDKIYDGQIFAAEAIRFTIAEEDLLPGDDKSSIIKSINIKGISNETYSTKNNHQVNINLSYEFAADSEYHEKYQLITDTIEQATIYPRELEITEVMIDDKIYDQTSKATIDSFELNESQIIKNDAIIKEEINLQANFTSINVGENIKVKVNPEFVLGSNAINKYVLVIKDEVQNNIRADIKPKPIKLEIKNNYRIEYSDFKEEEMKKAISILYNEEEVLQNDNLSDMELPSAALMEEIPCYSGQPCVTPKQGLQVIGIDVDKYERVTDSSLGYDYERIFAGKNYKYVFSQADMKNLIVEKESIQLREFIELSDQSLHVYLSEKNIYWVGNQTEKGKLYLKPTNNESGKYYNEIMYDHKNLTIDGLSYDEITDKVVTIYLKVEPDNGIPLEKGTECISESIEIIVKKDSNAPTASIKIGNQDSNYENDFNHIVFSVYCSNLMDASITFNDDQNEIEGSGVKEAYYAFYQVTEDIFIENEDDPFLNQVVWNKLENAEKKKTCILSDYIDSPDKELNYILLVKVEDQVGNNKIYCSNGIVIDHTEPEIQIQLPASNNYSAIYQGDIIADITAIDPIYKSATAGKVVSGLQPIAYKIYKDGKIFESGYIKEEQNRTLSINNRLPPCTLNQLQEKYQTRCGTVTINSKIFNSNHVRLEITAADQAGNTYTKSCPLKIDRTRPTVNISYTSKAKVKNERYFNQSRTAKILITERNFDPASIKFRLKKENTEAGIYSLNELKQLGITVTSWIDSEKGFTAESNTDKRTNTVTLTFHQDENYHFELIFCKDLAGNHFTQVGYQDPNDKANKHFIIDKTAPIIKIVYSSEGKIIKPGKSENKRIYQNNPIRAEIKIKEHNFTLNGMKVNSNVTLKAVNHDSNVKIFNADQLLKKAKTWTSNNDLQTAFINYKKDANYTFSLDFTDLAGNKAVYQSVYFTIDKTKPQGSIEIEGDFFAVFKKFHSYANYGKLFGNNIQQVTLKANDTTSPIKKIYYYKSNQALSADKIRKIKNWQVYQDSIFIQKEQQYMIYGKIVDQAGNIRYISSEGIILDTKNPELQMKMVNAEPSNGIYNNDIKITICARDPLSGNTYSGLKEISYQVFKDNDITERGSYGITNEVDTKRVAEYEQDIMITAQKNNSNNVKVIVTVTDRAGNQYVQEQKFKIDITKPQVSVNYQTDNPQNENYYKEGRTAVITIKERNFNEHKVQLNITNKEGKIPIISKWKHIPDKTNPDNNLHTAVLSFESDGAYTVTLSCIDLADNKGEYGKTDCFTIDQTAPVIMVTYSQSKAQNNNFYNTERTAKITIREHNFNAAKVKTTITASYNGQEVSQPSLSAFTDHGDEHSASIHFKEDGTYTLTISYEDMAGNAAIDYRSQSFVIDTTKPIIKIYGIKKSNNKIAAPIIEYQDLNYHSQEVIISIKGIKHENITPNMKVHQITNGEKIELDNFAEKEEIDDIYTLTVKVKDKAGNSSQKSYTFSVNRYGSSYSMDHYTSNIMEKYDINNVNDLSLMETNPDQLINYEIICSRDGEIYKLKEGNDYTVKKSESNQEWKSYQYRIKKENFIEDGKYIIALYSIDASGNKMSNQSKGTALEFVVDKTKPSLVITGIENGARYQEESRNLIVDAKDNIQLETLKIEIAVDGKKPEVYQFNRKELQKDYGLIEKKITSADKWQTIKVSATDRAGNICTFEDIQVLITPDLWVQFYMNKPLLFGSIVGVLLIILMVIKLFQKT